MKGFRVTRSKNYEQKYLPEQEHPRDYTRPTEYSGYDKGDLLCTLQFPRLTERGKLP